jgi:hypothetical protein
MVEARRNDVGQRSDRARSPAAGSASRLVGSDGLIGSLPYDDRTERPAVMFAPAQLRPPDPLAGVFWPDPVGNGAAVTGRQFATAADNSAENGAFLGMAEELLVGSDAPGQTSTARAADASYDFDEYVFLRNPADPAAQGGYPGPAGTQRIPSDPRFERFTAAARAGIAEHLDWIRLVRNPLTLNNPSSDILAAALLQTLTGWWLAVCAVGSFNRLGRYRRADLRAAVGGGTPEAFYQTALINWLGGQAVVEVEDFFLANGSGAALGRLLTVEFWTETLSGVFETGFGDIAEVDPTAPTEYPFETFAVDEVLFGIRVLHRQTWRRLEYARGDLVRTIPLGPRETAKVSVKLTRRRKASRVAENSTSVETTSEAAVTNKDTSEVVDEATNKLNKHLEAEVSGNYYGFVQGKVSGGLAEETASSSKGTKTRLNETMEKTASRLRRDTKVTVSTETEDTFERTTSSELVNPNDEVAITYLYHRLQQRYWVSTEVGQVDSVVFVPEPVPDWEDVDEQWARDHGDVLAGALLDPSFAPVLASVRQEPSDLAVLATTVFTDAASAGVAATGKYQAFAGGYMPDLLASGQEFYERDFERRNSRAMDNARRAHQSQALLTHLRRNILHYMRAIWASEDYDQRMQRYSRMRVPTAWVFVPRGPQPTGSSPTPLEVDGVFMPVSGSARPLTEVIDPIGPIGYLFNCAIYRLRDDPKLVNQHQALAYLRACYARFAVDSTVSAAAGVTITQLTPYAPRRFLDEFSIVFRTGRQKWLLPRPGRTESDWYELALAPDGSLDVRGVRIWLAGSPVDNATIDVRLQVTGELADPHLLLLQLRFPLPPPAAEASLFTAELLRQMTEVLPALAEPDDDARLAWATLDHGRQAAFRAAYHRFLMLRESGQLIALDTANLVLDLEVGAAPALEGFKRLHRYVDVLKEFEEYQRRHLEGRRRQLLLDSNRLGDPEIERVSVVADPALLRDLVSVVDEPATE